MPKVLLVPGSRVTYLVALRYRITVLRIRLDSRYLLVGGECSRLGYWAVTSLGVSSSLDGMGGRPWMCGMGWPKLLTVSSLAEMPDSGPDWRVCMSLRTPQCL